MSIDVARRIYIAVRDAYGCFSTEADIAYNMYRDAVLKQGR
jgi:hypothetical protein